MGSLAELPPIQTISALPEDERIAHMRANSLNVTKRFQENVPAHDRTAALCCPGPSLSMTWPQINGDVFTVSNAHDFLIGKGVVPFAHMDCDPRPHKHLMVMPHPEVQYWIASCIHPNYIDMLDGFDVTLWHLHNGPETEKAFFEGEEFAPGEWLLVGGGSIGLRAVCLLYSQGYRNFEIHGMDCSGGYVAPHTGKKRDEITVRCGNVSFRSNLSLIDYARQFLDDMRLWEGATFKMHGNGLLQAMCKEAK